MYCKYALYPIHCIMYSILYPIQPRSVCLRSDDWESLVVVIHCNPLSLYSAPCRSIQRIVHSFSINQIGMDSSSVSLYLCFHQTDSHYWPNLKMLSVAVWNGKHTCFFKHMMGDSFIIGVIRIVGAVRIVLMVVMSGNEANKESHCRLVSSPLDDLCIDVWISVMII